MTLRAALRAASIRMMALVVLCASLAAAACSDPQANLPCDAHGRRYDALGPGDSVCDTEHLVAALAPTVVDPNAGQGAIRVAVRVTRKEPRDYCFGDDDGERHTLSFRSSDGREIFALTAGDPCVPQTLEPAVYDVRIEHEHVGVEDPRPDTIYTKLDDVSGRPTLTFQSNGCPGCLLDDVAVWDQCRDGDDGIPECAIIGDFRNAHLAGKCQHGPRTRCILDGTFNGADLTRTSIGIAGDRVQRGILQMRGSFARVAFPVRWEDAPVPIDVSLTGVTSLGGTPPDTTMWDVDNEGEGLLVDADFVDPLNRAHSYMGVPAVYRDVRGLPGLLLDFDRVDVQPLRGGYVSFAGFDAHGSTLRHAKSDGIPRSFAGVKLQGAALEDSTFTTDDLTYAHLEGATLKNVVFQSIPGAVVHASTIQLDGASLSNVRFGDATLTASGVSFDFSGHTFSRAVLDGVQFTNADLRDAQWTDGTAITSMRALGSDLTNVSFDVAALGSLDFGYSTVILESLVVGSSGAAVTLDRFVARGAYVQGPFANATFSRCNLEQATLGGDFHRARFEACDLDAALLGCGTSSCAGSTFDAAYFGPQTTLNGALLLASANQARFDHAYVGGATFRASLQGAVFSATPSQRAHFCLPVDGSSSPYAGMSFTDGTTLTDVVMPLVGTSVPSGPLAPGQAACEGAITAAERDALVTAGATCPNGLPPQRSDCQGAEWDPEVPPVAPVCCIPKRGDPSCVRATSGRFCENECQCASLQCSASHVCR